MASLTDSAAVISHLIFAEADPERGKRGIQMPEWGFVCPHVCVRSVLLSVPRVRRGFHSCACFQDAAGDFICVLAVLCVTTYLHLSLTFFLSFVSSVLLTVLVPSSVPSFAHSASRALVA